MDSAKEFYKDHFGVSEPKDNDTTINSSVYHFAEAYADHKRNKTPFKNKEGVQICDGDILAEWVDIEGHGMTECLTQVYMCPDTGQWMVDVSYHKNRSLGDPLFKNLHMKKKGHISETESDAFIDLFNLPF